MGTASAFLVFVCVWWLQLMLVPAEEQQQGDSCHATTCGDLTISHPFWLGGKEARRPCGISDFEVTCPDNNTGPILRGLLGSGLTIINISYEGRYLRVVDEYKVKALNTCSVPRLNTTGKLGIPFKVDPGNLNLILYNCTTSAGVAEARWDRALVEIRCGNESNTFARAGVPYDETDDYAVEGCDHTVVPVLGSKSGAGNANDYEQLNGISLHVSSPVASNHRLLGFSLIEPSDNHVTSKGASGGCDAGARNCAACAHNI
ncbi:hypothetical protein ACQ4PT_011249 [Festuca glaucescens]